MKTQISTKHLNVHYGKLHILNDINVDIPEKKITAIIGSSGCGKTTLLKSFNRLLDLRDDARISGQILVDGGNVLDPKADISAVRKKMGLLLQRPSPLPMSIFDNVAYGLRIHGERDKHKIRDKVHHCLNEVGLWPEVKDRLDDPASKLSIGQQQRLCLARAIAVEPEILLCDEPTSALDPIAAQRIEQLLVKLKQNYTIILVTHTLRQAKRLADNVIFLYFGKVVEEAPADEFFNNPKDPKSKAYLSGQIV